MKKINIIKLALITGFSVMAFSAAANALDLQQARAQGLVTEKADGYIAATSATPEVNSLVNDVNSGRKQEYEKISKENGQPVDVVAKLAAKQIQEKIGR